MGRYYSNRKIKITDPNITTVTVNGNATSDWAVIKIAATYYLVVDSVLSTDTIAYS